MRALKVSLGAPPDWHTGRLPRQKGKGNDATTPGVRTGLGGAGLVPVEHETGTLGGTAARVLLVPTLRPGPSPRRLESLERVEEGDPLGRPRHHYLA